MVEQLLMAALPYIIPAVMSAIAGGIGQLSGESKGRTGNFLSGYDPKWEQLSLYAPNQQSAMDTLLGRGMQYTNFPAMEQQAINQFNQQIVPGLAERFTSTGGGLSSPAFASQLGQAGAGLAQNLHGMRANYGMNLLNAGLSPRYSSLNQIPGSQGVLGNLGTGLGQGMTALSQQYFDDQSKKALQNLNRGSI